MIFPKSKCSLRDKNPTDSSQVFKFISEDFGAPNCTITPSAFPVTTPSPGSLCPSPAQRTSAVHPTPLDLNVEIGCQTFKKDHFHSQTLSFQIPKVSENWDETTRPPNIIFWPVWSNDRSFPSKFLLLEDWTQTNLGVESWNSKVTSFQVLSRAMIFNKPHGNPAYTHQNHQKAVNKDNEG